MRFLYAGFATAPFFMGRVFDFNKKKAILSKNVLIHVFIHV